MGSGGGAKASGVTLNLPENPTRNSQTIPTTPHYRMLFKLPSMTTPNFEWVMYEERHTEDDMESALLG